MCSREATRRNIQAAINVREKKNSTQTNLNSLWRNILDLLFDNFVKESESQASCFPMNSRTFSRTDPRKRYKILMLRKFPFSKPFSTNVTSGGPKQNLLSINFGVIRSQEQDIMHRLQTKASHG